MIAAFVQNTNDSHIYGIHVAFFDWLLSLNTSFSNSSVHVSPWCFEDPQRLADIVTRGLVFKPDVALTFSVWSYQMETMRLGNFCEESLD